MAYCEGGDLFHYIRNLRLVSRARAVGPGPVLVPTQQGPDEAGSCNGQIWDTGGWMVGRAVPALDPVERFTTQLAAAGSGGQELKHLGTSSMVLCMHAGPAGTATAGMCFVGVQHMGAGAWVRMQQHR